jgi:tetratricopeptide (TPR) repeat protein
MAPEVLSGEPGGAHADVYALGVILYELFTLRPPFVGDQSELERAHLALRPPAPGLVADIPGALEDLILSCLAKDPYRRPPDASAVRHALGDARRSQITVAGPALAPAAPPAAGPGDDLLALAWLEGDAVPARVAAEVERAGGALVHRRDGTALAVFAAGTSDQPARPALDVAFRFLATWGGRAALHVDRLPRVGDGRAPSPPASAVDQPEGWLPPGPWAGLVLTRDAADAVSGLTVVPAGPPGFFAPAGPVAAPALPDLVGRAELVSALIDSARASFAGGRPGLALVLGGPGIGKSRVVREIAARAGEHAVHIVVETARFGATSAFDGEALRERARAGPLAVLIDDAHFADEALLDSLEEATRDGAGAPLWVLLAADERLDRMRPSLGERAARVERHQLQPLGDLAMRELAASLLPPAEYLPPPVLDRLARMAGGNPSLLTELVGVLKRERAAPPLPDRRSRELVIEAVERAPAAAGRWTPSSALDGLPDELVAAARVAAAAGPAIEQDELAWVMDALRPSDHGGSTDARAALQALAARGLVVDQGGGSWAQASSSAQVAIYRATPAAERMQIHRHALDYWRGRDGTHAMAAVARHAALAGAHAEATAATLALAEAAAAARREVEAERWYSAALLHARDASTRVRVLAGRGRVRWRLDRGQEALSDLAAARVQAATLGDLARVASILLDEAMVLDWFFDFAASADMVAEARPVVETSGDALLRARLLVASGRAHWRQERVSEALAVFAQSAGQPLDSETRLGMLLLWACAQCLVGELDEAEATFTEAEHLTEATEDRLHRCALHVNRFFLWAERGDSERGADDLRRAVRLARELGHPALEWGATHNLAKLLHAGGSDAEALPFAIRSFELLQRHMRRPGPEDALLLGRIAVALGDRESAARHLAWVDAHAALADAPPTLRVFHRALELVQQGGGAEAWDEVIADAAVAGVHPIEHIEILYLRAACEAGAGRLDEARGTIATARGHAERFPGWSGRLDALAATVPA